MNTVKILKRAWQVVWTCRVLWLFGAILAALIILGTIVAIPIFLLVMISPLLFLAGLVQVYLSNLWMLTYMECITF